MTALELVRVLSTYSEKELRSMQIAIVEQYSSKGKTEFCLDLISPESVKRLNV